MTGTLLEPAAAARRLGVSAWRVRKMDDLLKPMRTEHGTRLYHADVIDELAARRHAAKEMKQ